VAEACCDMVRLDPGAEKKANARRNHDTKLSRQRVATSKNLQFKTYFNTILLSKCYFLVLMSSLLFYNVENTKSHEKPWNE
jgi:hypothetical protein